MRRLSPGLWLPLLLGLPAILAVEASGLDMAIERYYFDAVSATFPWRNSAMLEVLAHDGLRMFLVVLATLVLLGLVLSKAAPQILRVVLPEPWTRPRLLAYLLAGLLSGPLLVSILKHTTTRPCPWHLAVFGGDLPYRELWEGPFFSLQQAGQCFPGGHASGGFALLALVPLLAGRRRLAVLVFALALGLAMGWGRMMQGAHFLSHNLWSAWFCWLAVVLCYVLIRPPLPVAERRQQEASLYEQA